MSSSEDSSGPESNAGSEVSDELAPQFELVDDVPAKEERKDQVPDVDLIHVFGVDKERRLKLDVLVGESVTSRKRAFTFQCDMSGFLLNDLVSDSIESQALQLLDHIASSTGDDEAEEPEKKKQPARIFVAYDIGALVVKKAIAIAASDESQWPGIFFSAVQFVFVRCFQRRKWLKDIDWKVWHFLYANRGSSEWALLLTPSCIRSLSNAAVEMSDEFLASGIPLRSRIISVFDSEFPDQGLAVFDLFTATLGVSTELAIQEPSGKDRPVPGLERLVCYRAENWIQNPQWTNLQRMLLPLAMPQYVQTCTNVHSSNTVTQSKAYQDWIGSTKSPVLYIQGEGEAHSRTLAEQVSVGWQSNLIKKQKYVHPVLSFSFSSHDPARSNMGSMICSTILQVRAAFSKSISPKWNVLLDLYRLQRGWTIEDLHNIFFVLASWELEKRGLLVLHDVDECDLESRQAFWELLQQEMDLSDCYVKVIVTSRGRLSLLSDSEKSSSWNIYDYQEESPTDAPSPPIPHFEWVEDKVSELCPGGHGAARVTSALQALEPMDRAILEQVLDLIEGHTQWTATPSSRAWSDFSTLLDQIKPSTTPAAMLDSILRSAPDQSGLQWMFTWLIYGHRPPSAAELGSLLCYSKWDRDPQSLPSPSEKDSENSLDLLKAWLPDLDEFGLQRLRIDHHVWDLFSDGDPGYFWNDIKPAAHQTMLDFLIAYLTSPIIRDRLVEAYDKYLDTYNADEDHLVPSLQSDDQDILYYAVTALPYHLERSTQTSKQLQHIFSSSEYPLMPWARMNWAMSNPFSRLPIEKVDSPIAILLSDPNIDPAFAKALKGAKAALDETSEASISKDSAVVESFVSAVVAADEDNALKCLQLVVSDKTETRVEIIKEDGDPDTNPERNPTLSAALWRATWLGLDQLVEALLEARVCPDPKDVVSIRYPTPLYLASIFGRTRVVQALVKAGANARVLRDDSGLLLVAAGNGHNETISALVAHDKGLLEMEQPNTPLYEACMWGSWKAAKTLLDIGAKSDLTTPYNGWVPITVAADSGYARTVKVLLENGADPDTGGPDQEDTALWPAIMRGQNIQCIQALLEHGANPNHERISPPLIVEICSSPDLSTDYKITVLDILANNTPPLDIDKVDSHGSTGMMWACSTVSGDSTVVDWLLAHNVDALPVNEELRGAIHYACVNGYLDIIRKLLERKPPLNNLTSGGETLLELSVDHGPELIGMLLDAGADPELEGGDGLTIINTAVAKEKVEVVKLLIERKVNHNHRDKSGWCSIHDACGHRANTEIVNLLHDAGVNLMDPTTAGQTPLHLAGNSQQPQIMALLLEFRGEVDIEQRNKEGETPLIKAASGGNVECMRRLLNAGADINARCASGWTPLMSVVNLEDPMEAVDFLLNVPGIDVSLSSHKQGAALHMACDNLDLPVINKLLDAGADINQQLPGVRPTPLMAACMPSDILESETRTQFLDNIDKVVRALVSREADIHIKLDTPISTILGATVRYAGPSTINYLVSEGLSLKQAGCLDRYPIHYAAVNGRENFETVFQSDRDVVIEDIAGKNALHWASQFGHVETVEMILSHAHSPEELKSRIEHPDIDGWTPICWALRPHSSTSEGMFSEPYDPAGTIQVLLENGADPNISVRMGEKDEFWTVLELAKLHAVSEEIMNLLTEAVDAGRPDDDDDHDDEPPRAIRPYKTNEYHCDICLNTIWGPIHQCETCPDFDVCKKCYGQINIYHGHKKLENGDPHTFKCIVESQPEVYDGPPSPDRNRKGSEVPKDGDEGGFGGERDGETLAIDDTMEAMINFEVDDIPEEGDEGV